MKLIVHNLAREHFIKVRKELNLDEYEQRGKVKTHTYTIHSFRGTVITRLTQAGYSEARINYLVGHAPRTTETKHYENGECKIERDPDYLLPTNH